MNASIVFGLFALYVASISLYLVLAGRQDSLLEILRLFWGRTLGRAFYFIVNVGDIPSKNVEHPNSFLNTPVSTEELALVHRSARNHLNLVLLFGRQVVGFLP